jgi:long-chain acyl-CoA synthetase
MNFTRVFDILEMQTRLFPQTNALSLWQDEGRWQSFSTTQIVQKTEEVSAWLLRNHLKKGDKIAIIGRSGSPQWNIIDFAAQQIGLITIPILAGVAPYQMNYILEETAVKFIFFHQENDFLLHENIIQKNIPTKILLNDIESLCVKVEAVEKENIETLKKDIHPEDLATIIYTSGTSAEPKGVMLTHHNLVSNIKSLLPLVPFINNKVALSFLPLSHIFERTITYTYMAIGAKIYYAGGIEHLEKALLSARPHYMSCVPRVIEKMYDKVEEIRESSSFVKKWLINFALRIGERYDFRRDFHLTYQLRRTVADFIVYRHWRKALGGRIEGIAVGAAALQPKLSRLFSAAQIPIREGYGCTETSPVVSMNRFEPGGVLFGTVGIPIPGVEVKIEPSDDYENGQGEVLVKGPNVMKGYYNKPADTQEAFTEDGWYRTGDIGYFEQRWFLKITDRKKDFFKTSYGRFVSPQVIENHLKTSIYIDQCMAIGLGKPYISVLIVPNFHQLKIWCEANKVHWTAPQYMVINPKVEKFFQHHIEELNKTLQGIEQIKKFHLLFEEWNSTNGELTPTLKLRRKIVADKHQKAIDKMYF